MAHNNPVFVGSNEGVKNSLSRGTANVLPLMRLSLNGTGPAAVKSFLLTIVFFLLIVFEFYPCAFLGCVLYSF